MPSIGLGVNKDNAAAPLRLTFYSDAHVDAQLDQTGDFRYNLSKIWACMGRAGVNGIMRDGLIERGDPYLGYAAGSIQEFIGGVFGAETWNTLLAAGLNGVAGDMLYAGGLWPWDDWLLHLAGVVVGPSPFVVEYWSGAAWAADTVTITPDLSGATGLNQRLRCARPANWVAVASGAAAEVRYWRRIRQTGPGAAVLTNAGYKDFFLGHVRDFFCEWDLKKGDDGAGTATSEFRDDSPFTLRFKDGRRFDSRTTISTFVQMGSVSNASRRRALGKPWAIISNRGHVIHPCKLYGGYIMGNPQTYTAGTPGVALRGLGSEVIGTRIHGFHENTLGAAGVTALNVCDDVRVSIDRDASATQRPILNLSIDPTGSADRITVDVHDVSTVSGANTTIQAGTMRGLRLTNDTPGGQLVRSGGSGPIELFDTDWGGPNQKTVNGTPSTPWREWRYLLIDLYRDVDLIALQGIPVRARGSDFFTQLEAITDANGQILNVQNKIPGAPITGLQNRNIFNAERFEEPAGIVTVLLDDPIIIEINPKDHPNYNPNYETRTERKRWPKKMSYDATDATYKYDSWQRLNVWVLSYGLGPPPPEPGAPSPYERRDIPATPYTPQDIPATPYTPSPQPATPYTRTAVPGSAYRPSTRGR